MNKYAIEVLCYKGHGTVQAAVFKRIALLRLGFTHGKLDYAAYIPQANTGETQLKLPQISKASMKSHKAPLSLSLDPPSDFTRLALEI